MPVSLLTSAANPCNRGKLPEAAAGGTNPYSSHFSARAFSYRRPFGRLAKRTMPPAHVAIHEAGMNLRQFSTLAASSSRSAFEADDLVMRVDVAFVIVGLAELPRGVPRPPSWIEFSLSGNKRGAMSGGGV
jgi:hypothetical protein